MRAIVHNRYGPPDVLALREVDPPVMGDDEVLVRVRAASVGPWDWRRIEANPQIVRLASGLRRPRRRVPGKDLAGHVEAVGRNVTTFQPGQEVYGETDGAFAELAVAPAAQLAPKPAGLTFEQAAAVPIAASTALIGLRHEGELAAGQKVLVIGASGGVGTFAVQMAHAAGAEVTGVCSTHNLDMVRSIGADHVVDYTRDDVTASGERYDVVFQVAGDLPPSALRRILTPTGTLVLCSGDGGRWIGPIGRIVKARLMSPFTRRRMRVFVALATRERLDALTELIDTGAIAPVIDRTYRLEEVPEAVRYVEDGHPRGKVVVEVGPSPTDSTQTHAGLDRAPTGDRQPGS